MTGIQRIVGAELRPSQLRDRPLRSAFLRVPAALQSRPHDVRWQFDNAARAECPSTPWRSLQNAIRATARAAALTRNAVIVHETRERIAAFYDALEADALTDLPDEAIDSVDMVPVLLAETEAEGPANLAQDRALAANGCRARLQHFVEAGTRHYHALGQALSKARRILAGHHSEPLRVAR